ncbi:hypothetical protein GFH30_12230 [Acinetobacter wanghuae]|uniref:Uncharacterized protein n=1 Tax=Acinetobacter wanghuae TaxID=2662362 RepID=A0A5Q0P5Z1_9GAMM|nr:hypothetical protein [Acinetobacter wanghuae]MQW92332.1 hypothetical protein [Acinetobacter wanghuae]QGA12083.1 hypothetical protein GFH30_12230 [Acinetobacter wanghuae]
MALNVGPDFKQRWLNVPEAVRQTFIDDLTRISDVLKPETSLQEWLTQDRVLQQRSERRIEEAYAKRKAELIEAARIRKQLALEKALADKRAKQQAYAEQLRQDEERKFAEQTEALAKLSQSLAVEVDQYASRFHKNPENNLDFARGKLNIDDNQILSELESLRLRLELEAETLIEQTLKSVREKLQSAAQDEIEYILKNSNLTASSAD